MEFWNGRFLNPEIHAEQLEKSTSQKLVKAFNLQTYLLYVIQ